MNKQSKMARKVVYELFILGLCIYVLAALAAVTFFPLDPEIKEILLNIDTAVCVFFLIDFGIRLYTAESKLGYLKWGWLDLVSSIPMIEPLRWGRFARVFRILRLLRGLRASKHLVEYMLDRRAESSFLATSLTALLLIVVSSIAIHSFESEGEGNIRGGADSLWWSIATITTVGYGDHYPVTMAGRIVAVITMVAGVGLFGAFTGFVASWFLEPAEEKEEADMKEIRGRLSNIEEKLERLIDQQGVVDGSTPDSEPETSDGFPRK